MHLVQKAIWYIESHLNDDLSLNDIAEAVGASPYHLARSFSALTDMPPLRYVRLRRLTKAAAALTTTRDGILGIAMDAGYGSHEAFTRAFAAHFGTSPAAVRRMGDLQKLVLLEPLKMDETPLETLSSPKLVDSKPRLIAGIKRRYGPDTAGQIPSQWQIFNEYIGHIPHQIGNAAFGICYNCDGEGHLDYLSGVEVSRFSDLPNEFETLRLPAQRYAVFDHRGHVSEIRRTWHTIFRDWMPAHEWEIKDAPEFEWYSDDFDPEKGSGTIQIWVPLAD